MATKAVKSGKSMPALDNDFNDDLEEPSLESADPETRKFARRLRIQKRAEFLQKLAVDDPNKDEESLTEKQINISSELLENIIREGLEVITNVRVANDAREIERDTKAKENYERLMKKLEENTKECNEKFDVIESQWSLISKLNDPLEIHELLQAQMKKCDEVLAAKDEIINELKEELAKADDVYFEDQEKQKDDIKLLVERIENQMMTVENAYARELDLIEKTMQTEQDTLVHNFQKQWEVLYKKEQEDDRIGDEKLKQIMLDYEEEMQQLRITHDEEFREQKIRLDKECQKLQQEVERTKAECLLNEEKLSYDYTVLKMKTEENVILKGQQKRKINKLQATLNALNKEYEDLENNTRLEKEKLSKQILKAHKNILELEEKSNLFTRVNEKQYLDIWEMNTENANKLVDKILTADRLIHERTLGVIWEPPKISLPKKEDLPSYRQAVEMIEKRKQEEVETHKMFEYKELDQLSPEAQLEKKVLNHILTQISNCSEYLIEEKLQELILNRSEEERTIVKLDNVFQALSISSAEEINVLLNFFLPYSYCRICAEKEETIPSVNSTPESSLKPCECNLNDKEKKLIETVKKQIKPDSQISETESDEIKSTCSFSCDCEASCEESESYQSSQKSITDLKSIEIKPSKFTCDQGHVLEIQAFHVTKAIKDFVTTHRDIERKNKLNFEERLKEKKYTISRNISEEDVKYYWSQYREMFGKEKEQLWDTVLIGLNKYHEALQDRHKLCTEIETVKRQNTELQYLLKNQEISQKKPLSPKQEQSSKPGIVQKLKITL